MTLRFVTATRDSQTRFASSSPLCLSLARAAKFAPLELQVFADNRLGLPELYNQAIEAALPGDTLAFVHDDVWIDDWMVALRLEEALASFDIVGVAGNARRVTQQEGWYLAGSARVRDAAYQSGAVAHGTRDSTAISRYGALPAKVKLLDGVFLAAKAATLQQHAIRFDPAFAFHFYDTDFCRACEAAGLRLGTWPIALTHLSPGRLASAEWNAAYRSYLHKWKD